MSRRRKARASGRLSPAALPTLLLGVGLLAACAGHRVHVDYDPEVRFETLRTYRWMPIERTGDPRVDNDLLRRRVVDAVDEALAARGLVLVEGGSDLLVVYHAAIGRVVDVANMTRGYGYGEGRGASVNYVREYDLGTLVIDLVGAESKQLVWRGSGQARLHEQATPAERTARVRSVAIAILERYPPAAESAAEPASGSPAEP